MYSDETLKTIAEMYDEGEYYTEMSIITGIKSELIPLVICLAIEKGYTEPHSDEMRETFMNKIKVRNLVKAGKTRHEIGMELEIRQSTISRYIQELREEGTIKQVARANMLKAGTYCKVKSTLAQGETIKCTPKVARSCVYGNLNTNDGLCRYIFITGECRSLGPDGCDYKACTKYSKVSRENPRIRIKEH